MLGSGSYEGQDGPERLSSLNSIDTSQIDANSNDPPSGVINNMPLLDFVVSQTNLPPVNFQWLRLFLTILSAYDRRLLRTQTKRIEHGRLW